MAVVDAPATASERRPPTPPAAELPRRRRVRAVHAEVPALAALAAVLDLWSLSTNGLANTYYAAAVSTMAADRVP